MKDPNDQHHFELGREFQKRKDLKLCEQRAELHRKDGRMIAQYEAAEIAKAIKSQPTADVAVSSTEALMLTSTNQKE